MRDSKTFFVTSYAQNGTNTVDANGRTLLRGD